VRKREAALQGVDQINQSYQYHTNDTRENEQRDKDHQHTSFDERERAKECETNIDSDNGPQQVEGMGNNEYSNSTNSMQQKEVGCVPMKNEGRKESITLTKSHNSPCWVPDCQQPTHSLQAC